MTTTTTVDLTTRERLLHALVQYAYEHRTPPFTLKSGAQSNHYVNCRSVALTPVYAELIGQLMAYDLASQGVYFQAVAGVPYGALPIAHTLAQVTGTSVCYVRKEQKAHGLQNKIDTAIAQLDAPLVLVEDVLTSGGSVIETLEALKAAHRLGTLKAICVLVDRQVDGLRSIRDWLATHNPNQSVDVRTYFTLSELVTENRRLSDS